MTIYDHEFTTATAAPNEPKYSFTLHKICRNDRVLVEALSLNDSLQDVLSKHGALVAGSSPPPETSVKPSKLNLPPPLLPDESHQFHNRKAEEEDEEDGFSIIAKRNSDYKSTGLQDISHNCTEQSDAMILFEPRPPVSSSKKEEEDMIDLLSLTLSPATAQSPISGSPSWEHYLHHPPPLPPSEDHNSYDSYIAQWARPAAVSQFPEMSQFLPRQPFPHYSPSYLPPPWPSTAASSNPFLSAEYIH